MSLEALGLGHQGNQGAYGGPVPKQQWAQEAQATTSAALVQPFGPREEGPSLRTQVQQLQQIVAQQQAQIQELAAALHQVRSVIGV